VSHTAGATLVGVAALGAGGIALIALMDPAGAVGAWVRSQAENALRALEGPAAAAGAGYGLAKAAKRPKPRGPRTPRIARVKTSAGRTQVTLTGLAGSAAGVLQGILRPLGAEVRRVPGGAVVVTAAAGAAATVLAAVEQALPILAAA
jgi:hypothetical protein